jgi:hypothetical protein
MMATPTLATGVEVDQSITAPQAGQVTTTTLITHRPSIDRTMAMVQDIITGMERYDDEVFSILWHDVCMCVCVWLL